MTSASDRVQFTSIEEAVKRFQEGSFLVVMDDEDRENEGDLILSAKFATPEKLAFIVRYTSGIICAPITPTLANKLSLYPMSRHNTDPNQTAFTVSVDHRDTTTGVSASDRSLTFRALAKAEEDPASASPTDFRRPGHVFPLVAKPGGVRERRGHTEVTMDFCKLANLPLAGLLAELNNDDGTMMRLKDCAAFAKEHSLPLVNIQQVATYLEEKEGVLQKSSNSIGLALEATCQLPIQKKEQFLGNWELRTYSSSRTSGNQVVLIKNPAETLKSQGPVLVRLHSECFTGNTLGSLRCDCEDQLDQALIKINEEGKGVAIYLEGHEGRGIGLNNKLKAYSIQDEQQLDTYAANESLGLPKDARSYEVAVAILKDLGIENVSLLTNNKFKVEQLRKQGFVVKKTPLPGKKTEFNSKYLEAKKVEQEEDEEVPQEKVIEKEEVKQEVSSAHSKQIPIALPIPSNVSKLRLGIIKTSWNSSLVDLLVSQTKDNLLASGVLPSNLFEMVVPGSYEVPWAAQLLLQSYPSLDGVLCFGVLIKGETMHFEYISSSVSTAIMKLQMKTGVPVIYGILNCLTLEQAEARCGTSSQLPLSLSATAIHMAALRKGYLPLAISTDNKTLLTSPFATPSPYAGLEEKKSMGYLPHMGAAGPLFSGFPSVFTQQPCDSN